MENQIEQVKERTDIVGLVSGYVSLKKAGRNYKGLCPFHNEKTPSFMVSPDRQIFKCFGCGEGGDVLSFFQKIEGIEFHESLIRLANKAGIQLKEQRPNPEAEQKEVLKEIYQKAADFYHFILLKHASGRKALEYLKVRGLTEKTIKDWQLGYAPDSWDSLVKFLAKKNLSTKDIVRSGLVLSSQRKGNYDRFRKRIIFPIRNISGEIIAFSGRIFGEGEPKYLNSPDSPIFNKSSNLFGLDMAKTEIKKENQTVLVEGNLDVLSSYQAGVKNVVAPLGTALTERQLLLLKRFSENIIVSFDQDRSGISASKRVITMAEELGMNIRLTNFSEKDPDELIRKDPLQWKKSLKEAVPIYDYLIDKAVKSYGTETPEAIRKITSEVTTVLAKIENEIALSHYERLLAKILGVSEEAVAREVTKRKKPFNSPAEEIIEKPTLGNRDKLERYLLALILQGKVLPRQLESKDFQNLQLAYLFQLIRDNFTKNLKVLEEKIPEELRNIFDSLTLLELPSEIVSEERKIEFEIDTCVKRLKELNLRARLKELTLSIKQAEISKEVEKLQALEKEFAQLSKNLTSLTKER